MTEILFDTDKNDFQLSDYSSETYKKAWCKHTCKCGELHSWEAEIRRVIFYIQPVIRFKHNINKLL